MSEDKKDVKQEVNNSEEVKTESSSENQENEISFEELTGMQEKKIPYSRFKEVNDEKKALKAELEKMKVSIKNEIEDAILKEQMKSKLNENTMDSFEDLLSDTDSSSEINSLKEQISMLQNQLRDVTNFTEQNALKQEMSALKKIFPSMNEEHVLALKKMHNDASLEECAKFSHDQFMNHAKNVYEKLLEEKKASQEKKVVLGAERLRNLKPEERPKSLAEAREAMYKFIKE